MATDPEREDSVLEINRQSLLEIVEDRNRQLNKVKVWWEVDDERDKDKYPNCKNVVHRLVYVAKLRSKENENETDVDRTEIGKHFENMLKIMQGQNEPVTGMMLIYLKLTIHMIESSMENILEIIKEAVKDQRSEQGFLCDVKIISICHNVSQRIYQQWNFRTLDIHEHGMEAYEPRVTTEKLVIDIVGQMLRLGCHLARQPRLNLKDALDSLHEKVPELLPRQGAIYYLLQDSDQCLMKPEEFMLMYENPFDIVLDTDLVWPLPVRIFPYN